MTNNPVNSKFRARTQQWPAYLGFGVPPTECAINTVLTPYSLLSPKLNINGAKLY